LGGFFDGIVLSRLGSSFGIYLVLAIAESPVILLKGNARGHLDVIVQGLLP
jgi:hypothetical protein